MKYIHVNNFEKFQHYKAGKNNPRIWIKLYLSILTDFHYIKLSDDGKLLYLSLLFLAGSTVNCIPLDENFIKTKCGLEMTCDFLELQKAGFIAIKRKILGKSYENPRKILEQKRREEKRVHIPPVSPKKKEKKKVELSLPELPQELDTPEFREHIHEFIEYRNNGKSPLTDKALKIAIGICEAMGSDVACLQIEQTILNGWKGIFPPKNGSKPIAPWKDELNKLTGPLDEDDPRFKLPFFNPPAAADNP